MFDAVAEHPPASETKEVRELNTLKTQTDAAFLRAYRCESFGLTCYALFFAFLIMYLVSIVILGIGAGNTTQLPSNAYNSIQNVMKDADNVLDNTMS